LKPPIIAPQHLRWRMCYFL